MASLVISPFYKDIQKEHCIMCPSYSQLLCALEGLSISGPLERRNRDAFRELEDSGNPGTKRQASWLHHCWLAENSKVTQMLNEDSFRYSFKLMPLKRLNKLCYNPVRAFNINRYIFYRLYLLPSTITNIKMLFALMGTTEASEQWYKKQHKPHYNHGSHLH